MSHPGVECRAAVHLGAMQQWLADKDQDIVCARSAGAAAWETCAAHLTGVGAVGWVWCRTSATRIEVSFVIRNTEVRYND